MTRIGIILALLACSCTRSDNTEPSTKQPPPFQTAPAGQPDQPKGRPMSNTADAAITRATLELGAAVTGTTVAFTLTNVGDAPVVVDAAVVAGGERHLDWFRVVLEIGGAERELRFLDDRNRSAIERKTLDPGGSLTEKADLATWAKRARNGGTPLPRGAGTLRAFYEVTGDPEAWNGKLEAGPIAVDLP